MGVEWRSRIFWCVAHLKYWSSIFNSIVALGTSAVLFEWDFECAISIISRMVQNGSEWGVGYCYALRDVSVVYISLEVDDLRCFENSMLDLHTVEQLLVKS